MVLINIIHKKSCSFFTCEFVTVVLHSIKWAIFVSRSTTTKIESKALELGRSMMKSIDIEDHGFFGFGSGRNNPYGQ
jgi:hypothetical protein